MQIDIHKKTEELKKHISQFDTISFVTQYYYALNTHLRSQYKILKVESPLRQIAYLLSLFLDTKRGEKKKFDLITGDASKISSLLEEIEAGYRYNYIETIKDSNLNEELIKNHLLVANQSFINYFSNGVLNFVEQEIDRIQKTFAHSKDYVLAQTGLTIDDYLRFYEVTDFIELHKIQQFTEETTSTELKEIFDKIYLKNIRPSSEQFEKLFCIVEDALYKLPIPVDLLYKMMGKEKIDKLLEIFAAKREEYNQLRYYTDPCTLLSKPVIWLNDQLVILPVQKQLIHAIFNFLFETCKRSSKNGKAIFQQKDKTLEEKTFEVFDNFFSQDAHIFKNFYVAGKEKDLLVLCRGTAFIIESKAYNYREPLRDPSRAFERIRDDFKKEIQQGYTQAWDLKRLFMESKDLEIKDKNGNITQTIRTSNYHSCFSIIVTNERYGQIQCDLGLLLELDENDIYPWSVCVDDLETFLLTLKRRNNFFGDFKEWLTLREKLHGRLFCFDELELCSYFLMQPKAFAEICNQLYKKFLSSPDMHQLFDNLYETGLGFKNERYLDKKAKRECLLSKSLKLKIPDVIKEYRKQTQQDKPY